MYVVGELLSKFSKDLNDVFTESEKKQIGKMFLRHHLKYDSNELLLNKDKEVPKEVAQQIEKDITKINNGKPVQYVLGTTHFYGLDIKTDPRALIPRPETEELVDWVVEVWKDEVPKIIDVGTGTGCIAFALKKSIPNSVVYGVDVIQNALELAEENADELNLDVKFEYANALNLAKFFPKKWDVIVSNPPYIPMEEQSEIPSHVLNHEPITSLFVPTENPFLFYKAITLYAKEHLNPRGSLFFEIHEEYSEEIDKILSLNGFNRIEIRKDLQGKDRMIHAQF